MPAFFGHRDRQSVSYVAIEADLSTAGQQIEPLRTDIYTIGMFTAGDPDANPGVLKRLAKATGGEAFFPEQFSEVADMCAHIAEDIRNQYMIGYVSTNAKQDGVHRTVRLVAETLGSGKFRVRTRTGYIAPGAAK